jgi:protein phosphatase 1 regulatory subunit 7
MLALETGYFFDNQLEDLQITGLEKLTFLDVKQNPMPDELYDFYDKQEGIVISHDGNADDWQ